MFVICTCADNLLVEMAHDTVNHVEYLRKCNCVTTSISQYIISLLVELRMPVGLIRIYCQFPDALCIVHGSSQQQFIVTNVNIHSKSLMFEFTNVISAVS